MKDKAMEVPAIREIIEKMEAEMAGNGRILAEMRQVEPNPPSCDGRSTNP